VHTLLSAEVPAPLLKKPSLQVVHALASEVQTPQFAIAQALHSPESK
jgi:hypothetical protein